MLHIPLFRQVEEKTRNGIFGGFVTAGLGHASVRTTERYLGLEQDLVQTRPAITSDSGYDDTVFAKQQERYRKHQEAKLQRKAKEFGFQLVPLANATA